MPVVGCCACRSGPSGQSEEIPETSPAIRSSAGGFSSSGGPLCVRACGGDRTGAGTPIKQAERWRSAHAEYNEIMEEILEALVKKNNGTIEAFMKDVQCALAGGEGFLFEDDNYSEFVERIQAMDDYECFHRIMCEAAQKARSRHK